MVTWVYIVPKRQDFTVLVSIVWGRRGAARARGGAALRLIAARARRSFYLNNQLILTRTQLTPGRAARFLSQFCWADIYCDFCLLRSRKLFFLDKMSRFFESRFMSLATLIRSPTSTINKSIFILFYLSECVWYDCHFEWIRLNERISCAIWPRGAPAGWRHRRAAMPPLCAGATALSLPTSCCGRTTELA